MIRFDFDDRYASERTARAVPWFVRVLIADAAFYLVFLFVFGPWIALLWILLPHDRAVPEKQVVEDRTPLVFLQPEEIPPALLRPPPTVRATPADRPADHIVLPGNTRPYEAGSPPAPQQTKAAEPPPEPPPPEPPAPAPPRAEAESQIARNATVPPPLPSSRNDVPRPPIAGVLGRALQNLDRYAQQAETQGNPLGGATDDPGSADIQFDRKGVNFDPWLRRFVSQVRRNWFVPLSAMSFKGHVVLQFVIHKDGRITDLRVARASDIDSFNRSAYNAIWQSNPTEPLPAEYPDQAAPFTVTFYYNERVGN